MDWVEIFLKVGGGLGVLVAGIGYALPRVVDVWKLRAKSAADELAQEAAEARWKLDTINALRAELSEYWAEREREMDDRHASMRRMAEAQAERIAMLEADSVRKDQRMDELQADASRKQARIEQLTEKVHQLEMENASLRAQRDARDEKIDLLERQVQDSQRQTAALFTLAGDVSKLVQMMAQLPGNGGGDGAGARDMVESG